MRYSARHKTDVHTRIVDAASRGFRDRGLARLGVAEVMAQVGLTHGGFYAHFAGKEELVIAACAHALGDARARFGRLADRNPRSAARALVDSYLASSHRTRRADGCPIAALGSELARSSPAIRTAIARELDGMLQRLSDVMPGATAQRRRDLATFLFATLIGSLLISRLLPDRAGHRSLQFARKAIDPALENGVVGFRADRGRRKQTRPPRQRSSRTTA